MAKLSYLFELESCAAEQFRLETEAGTALTVQRKPSDITEIVRIEDQWQNHYGQNRRGEFPRDYVLFVATVRKEFRISDAEAALKGEGDNAWNRYRDAQTAVVNDLENAAKNLITDAAKNAAVLDAQRAERFGTLEANLRDELQKQRERLTVEVEAKKSEIEAREKAALEREASFNTKESHFVARQKQDAQIQEVKNWLQEWALTKGTSSKRNPVLVAYVVGICASAVTAFFATKNTYEILKTAGDVATLQWWQWVVIIGKSIVPLALCATFLVYFIRWASAWARQHAEEEFRNRALLIDIGRAGWLLEAVRDAQVRQTELPEILLKELSRNLFAYSSGLDADTSPQTVPDLLMKGLTKLRVKQGSDGTEVEAVRGKA